MAIRKFILSFGQSNAGPYPDYTSWAANKYELNLGNVSLLSRGSYTDKFTMPGSFPGYTSLDLKGVAVSGIRPLTWYDPLATGYYTYPMVGRLSDSGSATLTTTTLDVSTKWDLNVPTPFNIVRTKTGATHSVTAVSNPVIANVGTRLTIDSATPWTDPLANEEFTYPIVVMSGSNTAKLTLSVGFGTFWGGKLDGLKLTSTAGGNPGATKVIQANAPQVTGAVTFALAGNVTFASAHGLSADDEVRFSGTSMPTGITVGQIYYVHTVVSPTEITLKATPAGASLTYASAGSGVARVANIFTVTLPSAFSAAIGAADPFTISPQTGTFQRLGYFLPWCPYEANLVAGKVNPYPPGFDYPNHWHTPPDYRPAAGVGGTGGASVASTISYWVGLAQRVHEYLGETLYVISCDFGGSALAHNEQQVGVAAIGWADGMQQTHWSPGEGNNCFARLMEELDAALTAIAAAGVGDTLECVGCFFIQGETDAVFERMADRYAENLRAFKTRVRQELKNRGMWPGTADSIPWVQPGISSYAAWVFYEEVNAAIDRVASEDRYMRTFSALDIARKVGDEAHYSGAGATVLEARCYEAWVDIKRSTVAVAAGEVEICNLALSHIGETAKVTSIDPPDSSAQAVHCARFYSACRDTLLETRSWSFASRRATLTTYDSEVDAWEYAYLLPADFLCVTTVSVEGTADSTPSEPYSVETDAGGNKVLYTNVENAQLRYVARVIEPARYTPNFKMALSWLLAGHLAGAIIKGDAGAAEAKRCVSMATTYIVQATSSDTNQKAGKITRAAPWISGR